MADRPTAPRLEVAAMVAADGKDGIARRGAAGKTSRQADLPWRLPTDLKRMKRLTIGEGKNAILVGRTTFETLPNALPRRLNLVLTRRDDATFAGALAVTTWAAALDAARDAGCETLWVLGGAEVYALAMAEPELDRIELTRIEGDFACDVHWPGVPAGFVCVHTSEVHEEHGVRFRFERWERESA